MKARYDPQVDEFQLLDDQRYPPQQTVPLNETISALTEQSQQKDQENLAEKAQIKMKPKEKMTKNGSEKSLPNELFGQNDRQTSLLDQCLLDPQQPSFPTKSDLSNNYQNEKNNHNSGRSHLQSKWGTSRNQNAMFSQNSQLLSNKHQQILKSPKNSSSRQPVVISMNCSRAISTHNYSQLEKLVKNHIKEKQAKEGAQAANSFQEKQKALEQRIEKLRKIENQVRYWEVCSKKNCPPNDELAPKQFKELVNEFNLENQLNSGQNSKFSGGPRLLNGSGLLAQKLTSTLLAAGHGKKEKTKRGVDLDGLQCGTYLINSDDSDQEKEVSSQIQKSTQNQQTPQRNRKTSQSRPGTTSANSNAKAATPVKVNTNALSFNFMRKHQVQKVTHDIPLSVLLQQKREKARKRVLIAKQEEIYAKSAMHQRNPSPLNVEPQRTEQENRGVHSQLNNLTPQKSRNGQSRNCATMINSNAASYDRNPFMLSQPSHKTGATGNDQEEQSAYFNNKRDYTPTQSALIEPESPIILTSQFRSITPQPDSLRNGGRQSVTANQGVRSHKKHQNQLASRSSAYGPLLSGQQLKMQIQQARATTESEKVGQENPQLRASNSLWKLASQAHNQEFKGLLTEEKEEENSNEIERQLRKMILDQRDQQSKAERQQQQFVVDPQMIKIMYQYVQSQQQRRSSLTGTLSNNQNQQTNQQPFQRGQTNQFGRQTASKTNNLSQLGSYSTTMNNRRDSTPFGKPKGSFMSKTPQNSAFQQKMTLRSSKMRGQNQTTTKQVPNNFNSRFEGGLSNSPEATHSTKQLFKEVNPIIQNNLEKIKNILRQVDANQIDGVEELLINQNDLARQITPLDLTKLNKQGSNQASFQNFTGLDNNQIAKQVDQIQQIDKNVKTSPQKDSKVHLVSKQEIEDTVMRQFKRNKASDHYQSRAVENYLKQRLQNGISAEDVQRPAKMLHFHIDAFEDNIQMNLYQEEAGLLEEVDDVAFDDNRMQEVQVRCFEDQTNVMGQQQRRSTHKSTSQNQQRPPSISIPRSNTTVMPTLNLFGKKMQKKEKSSVNGSSRRLSEAECESDFAGTDSTDTIDQSVNGLYVKKDKEIQQFEHFSGSLGGIDSYLLQSPELRTKKRSKESNIKQKFAFRSTNSPDKVERQQQLAQQRTLLMSKEISDQTEYFSNMELPIFNHFTEKMAKEAFKVLVKSSRPIFSGNVDFRINLLDPKKVIQLAKLKNIQQKVGQSYHLLKEAKEMNEQLQNRSILHGIWDQFSEVKGFYPEGRKSSTINLISNQLYLFGGTSRDTFNDVRKFDLYDKRWTLVEPKSSKIPQVRSNHTMCNYKAKLVLFGGCGAYMKNLNLRPSLNDLWTFDTMLEKWQKIEGSGIRPKKRRAHTSAILGSLLLIHGGQNTESRALMDDFNLFDLEACHWFKTKVFMGANEVESVNQYGTTIDSDTEPESRLKSIGLLMNHSMVSLYERTNPHQPSTIQGSKDVKEKLWRQMWIKEREWSKLEIKQGRQYQQGFYLFGGVDSNNQTQNDLWLIKPHYEMNKKAIDYSTFNYLNRDPELALKIKKITDYKGRKPCPRFQASMIHLNLRKSGKQLLVIYGGRNDSIFEHTGNLALNDICIFNVNQHTWEALAMFGQMPTSRWAHCLAAVPNQSNHEEEGFVMFGGINTQTYCRSKLYSFTFPGLSGLKGGNLAPIQDRRTGVADRKNSLLEDDLPDFIRRQTTLIDKDTDYAPQTKISKINSVADKQNGAARLSKGTEIGSSTSGIFGQKFTQLQESIKDRIEILREVVQREQKIAEKKKESKQS